MKRRPYLLIRRLAPAALLLPCLMGMTSRAAFAQAPEGEDSPAKLFKANCLMCHGEDGAGSPLGQRLHTPDLRSKEIHDKPEATLEQSVTAGKNNMPPFGTRLNHDQIKKLIEYVRQFHMPDPAHPGQ